MSVITATSCARKDDARTLDYKVDAFADLEILRYQVPDFENLSLRQKTYIYYLSQAALCGRDILFDQNNAHNLKIRRTLEAVYEHYQGDRTSDEFKALEVYLKRVWFSNGIHHLFRWISSCRRSRRRISSKRLAASTRKNCPCRMARACSRSQTKSCL